MSGGLRQVSRSGQVGYFEALYAAAVGYGYTSRARAGAGGYSNSPKPFFSPPASSSIFLSRIPRPAHWATRASSTIFLSREMGAHQN